jgi:cytochrome oxidase Cu insertion factor (SCO1/SenC/PrrC family)
MPGGRAAKTPLDLKVFYGFVGLVIVAMLGLLFWRPSDSAGGKMPPGPPRQLGAFAFTDQTGQPVTQATVAGKFAVVNFVHTSCAVSCLQVNQHMAEVQRRTAGQADVHLLSFTVDPRTDTPPVLAEFAKKYGADAARWSFLTGNKTELYALIETSFLRREPLERSSPMPGGFQDVDRIAVVDRTGRVRRYFDGLRPETPQVIAKFLDELRKESK